MPNRVEEVRFRKERVWSENLTGLPLLSCSGSMNVRDSGEGVGGLLEDGVKSKFRRGEGRSKEECSVMVLVVGVASRSLGQTHK